MYMYVQMCVCVSVRLMDININLLTCPVLQRLCTSQQVGLPDDVPTGVLPYVMHPKFSWLNPLVLIVQLLYTVVPCFVPLSHPDVI